mmetsp:Transcript_106813/g.184250  ORF Transcript_106813/g.184250 Transcript_106813/m.184250 type:complete len:80 (+) Transcript_106813:462-701(+)
MGCCSAQWVELLERSVGHAPSLFSFLLDTMSDGGSLSPPSAFFYSHEGIDHVHSVFGDFGLQETEVHPQQKVACAAKDS